MYVKDVLEQAAFLLGKEELCKFIHENAEEQDDELRKETEMLLRCYNMIENEIALDYMPLTAEETMDGGKIYYEDLSHTPVSILTVTDDYGAKYPFTIFPEYAATKEGPVVIAYTYEPKCKGFSDECEFGASVSVRLIGYGVAGEFCLIEGRYDDALIWDKKYKEGLTAAYDRNRPRVVRTRRWV